MKTDLYHCSRNNMTYFQHWKRAMKIFLCCFGAGLAAFVHAWLPFILCDTASSMIHDCSYWLETEEVK